MFVKLLRSVAIGLIVGAILLAAMPSLRKIICLPHRSSTVQMKMPASYNPAVRRAAPAVVNVYNRSMNSTAHNQLEIRTLGSGVIMDQRGYIITNKHVINDANHRRIGRTVAYLKRCLWGSDVNRPCGAENQRHWWTADNSN